MRHVACLVLAACPLATTLRAQQPAHDIGALPGGGQVYTVDNAHSLLDFTVRLVGFNRVRGNFTRYSADLYYDPDHIDRSVVNFLAETPSISTGVDERDSDLRAASFLDVARFPALTFRSTGAQAAAGGFVVTGDLTIRDSTHRITLPVQVTTPLATDPFGNRRASFATTITINRRDYGVVGPDFWNNAIADSVTIEIELGARLWDWTTLGFSSRRHSIGELLLAAADSNRLVPAISHARSIAAQHDSTWNLSAWDFEKAAMRLVQRQRYADALRIMDLAVDVTAAAGAGDRSEMLARRGEIQLRLGHRNEALNDLRQALSVKSTNTNAQVWLRVAGG